MKIKTGIWSNIFDFFNVFGMVIFCFAIIFPLWDMIAMSFTPAKDSYGLAFRLWPNEWQLSAYRFAFRNSAIMTAYLVTINRSLIGPLISLICNVCFAYGLSKKDLPFHNFLTTFILVPMFFGGGMIANYLLIKQLGLFDNFLVYVIPGAVGSYNIILLRNYFQNMDRSLEEAARIDGATYFRIVFTVVIPLSKPILATLALWGIVAHWNAWFDCLLYINNKSLYTLTYILRRMMVDDRLLSDEMLQYMTSHNQQFMSKNLKAAITIINIVPIMCVYPFLQKHFVKGIMIGALKG